MANSRYLVLAYCTAMLLITSAGISSFSLFLNPIEVEFDWSRARITLPYTLAMASWGLSAPLFGKLADDHGSRPVILGGIVLMAAGFVGMGLSQNLWQLSLTFGVLVGLAMGACTLTIVSLLISRHFDSSSRGRAVSLIQAAPPLNPLLFAPILYFLIWTFDWRAAAFAVAVLLIGVALPLAWIGAREPPSAPIQRRDPISWSACFQSIRNRPMILLFLARFSCGFAFFQIAHLAALTLNKGFNAQTGAKAVAIFGASAAVCALLFGWLSDRYGRSRILGFSYFIRGLGSLALALPIPNEFLLLFLIVVGIGPTFGTVAVTNVMFYEAVGPRLAGTVLGLSFIVHQVGSAVGPLLGSLFYDYSGTYDGFLVAIGLVFLVAAAMTYHLGDLGGRLAGEAGKLHAARS